MGVFVLSKDNKQLGEENSKDLNSELEQIKGMFEEELKASKRYSNLILLPIRSSFVNKVGLKLL